jgi:hypothetical protein
MKFLLSDDASMAQLRAAREKIGIIAGVALGIRASLGITIKRFQRSLNQKGIHSGLFF